MNVPLRIVHVLEKNRFDTGSVHQMFQAAAGMVERGHRVWIVSREGEEMRARCAEAGVDFEPQRLRSEVDLGSILGIRRLVEQAGADVIHVHKGLPHTLALAATWRNRVPAFVVNRGVSFPLTVWNRPKYRTQRVDRIVCVCERIRQVVIASGRLDPGKVEVVYAGTDVTEFDPERWDRGDFRTERGIRSDAFVFAQVGVRDWKGWRELTDAFALVHRKHPRSRLMLIAFRGAAQRDEIAAYAASKGIAEAVVPVEYRSDMPRVLAAADAVADASWDGTGVTGAIREAMSLRKPIVATDCGGNRELVSTPEVGWLIPPRDREALSNAMLEIIEQPARASAVAARAREHVRAGFSKQVRLERLEALYRRIIGLSRSSVDA
ncbi:MAG TPA: glycosyltransferase family 4 protein [Thermoanaerobaculia bacterium]|nr:glycosyltransferase family 4 protein [Thermoanaerobaculia bacterium]